MPLPKVQLSSDSGACMKPHLGQRTTWSRDLVQFLSALEHMDNWFFILVRNIYWTSTVSLMSPFPFLGPDSPSVWQTWSSLKLIAAQTVYNSSSEIWARDVNGSENSLLGIWVQLYVPLTAVYVASGRQNFMKNPIMCGWVFFSH